MIMGPAARVMSLRDGTKKMSKSDASDMSRINLTDTAEQIADKIRRAKTDPEPLPTETAGLENRPEARNLIGIYAALTDTDHQGVLADHGGKGFAAFKQDLTALLVDKLSPIAAETSRLLGDPATLDAILREGSRKAEALALPIVEEAEKLVGFLKS
jgi:tryptophanyl-tRNA synthetase